MREAAPFGFLSQRKIRLAQSSRREDLSSPLESRCRVDGKRAFRWATQTLPFEYLRRLVSDRPSTTPAAIRERFTSGFRPVEDSWYSLFRAFQRAHHSHDCTTYGTEQERDSPGLRFLTYRASRMDLKLPLLESAMPSNERHLEHAIRAALELPAALKIGVFGLAFKRKPRRFCGIARWSH